MTGIALTKSHIFQIKQLSNLIIINYNDPSTANTKYANECIRNETRDEICTIVFEAIIISLLDQGIAWL